MSNPERDRIPEALDELDRALERLTHEFVALRRRMESLADEIRVERGLRPKGAPATASSDPVPPPSARPDVGPPAPRPVAVPGPPAAAPGPPAEQPGRPAEPKPSLASRVSLSPTMIIAAIGGAVLLVGVGLFLVMAAQAGLFGPPARVISAAVAAAALVAGGIWLQLGPSSPHRRAREIPTGEVGPLSPGALALIGVGFATAVLDVLAATVLYGWVPVPFGFLLVGLLALGGLLLARRWRSDFLAGLFSLGAMGVAPWIDFEIETAAFVVVIAVLTAALCLERGPAVRYIRSVTPALFLFAFTVVMLPDTVARPSLVAGLPGFSEFGLLVVLAVALAGVGVVVALIESRSLGIGDTSVVLAVIFSGLPLGLAGAHTGFWAYVPLLAAVAYFAGALAEGRMRHPTAGRRDAPLSLAFGVTALLLVPGFLFSALDGRAIAYGIVILAIVTVLASRLDGQRWLRIGAGVTVLAAAVTWLWVLLPVDTLFQDRAVSLYTGSHAGFAALATLLALALVAWVLHGDGSGKPLWLLVSAAAALTTLSVTIIVSGVTLGSTLGDPELWFQLGHLLTTTLWVSLAAYLILGAPGRLHEPRKAGFVLVGLAVAKLFLVDLGTLPGIIRVVAFVLVGAVLITVAVISGSRRPEGGATPGPSTSGGGTTGPGGPGDGSYPAGPSAFPDPPGDESRSTASR